MKYFILPFLIRGVYGTMLLDGRVRYCIVGNVQTSFKYFWKEGEYDVGELQAALNWYIERAERNAREQLLAAHKERYHNTQDILNTIENFMKWQSLTVIPLDVYSSDTIPESNP